MVDRPAGLGVVEAGASDEAGAVMQASVGGQAVAAPFEPEDFGDLFVAVLLFALTVLVGGAVFALARRLVGDRGASRKGTR